MGSVAILSDGVEESQFAVADCRKYEEGFIAEGTEYTEFAEKWEKGNAGAAAGGPDRAEVATGAKAKMAG